MKREPEVLKTFPVTVDGKEYTVKLIAPHQVEDKPEPIQTHPTENAYQFFMRREHARMGL